jgi:hypothetical protein
MLNKITGEFRPLTPEDEDNNLGLDTGVGETMRGLIKDHLEKNGFSIPSPQGPILALYAGTAGAEKELFKLLKPADQHIVAVDYNPLLVSTDPKVEYRLGNVLDVLRTIKTESMGMVTIFNAHGCLELKDWPVIWAQN